MLYAALAGRHHPRRDHAEHRRQQLRGEREADAALAGELAAMGLQ